MWKNKYFNLMFSKDPKKIDTLQGFKLKLSNIPPLYKYREIHDNSLNNLRNDTAWFNKATRFNDPYDSGLTTVNEENYEVEHKNFYIKQIAKDFKVPDEEIAKIMSSLSFKQTLEFLFYNYSNLRNTPQLIPDLVNEILIETKTEFEKHNSSILNMYQEKVYASCFSEDPASMLMWSHYANNHKGMVLEYDFNKLDIQKNDDILWGLHPVNYTENLLNLDEYKDSRDHMSVVTLASLSKSKEWSYEKEWRMIILKKENDTGFDKSVITPTSIILGARIEDDKRKLVMEIAKNKSITVKQIKIDSFKYHLSVVDLNC